MALIRIVRRGCLSPRRLPLASRRRLLSNHSSTTGGSEQTRFSLFLPARSKGNDAQLLAKLRDSDIAANPNGHNAAVVLATPNFARQLESSESGFVGDLARVLSGSAALGQFHVLCAVVDQLAPALGMSGAVQGISVLRGHLDSTLPELWQPSPPRAREDADSVAALTFDLGSPCITLPLTRTTFQNNRTSTLLTSRFDMATGSARLVQQTEKHWQRIAISLKRPPQSIADLGLWAPLSPITRARAVTDSFGNIIRGVRVEGKTEPASMELEDAVHTMFKHRSPSETTPGPMGVWAIITPESRQAGLDKAPDPTPILQGKPATRDTAEAAAKYIEQAYRSGGRVYQILSGGGGWGPKKGLLSMDPQRTHFALPEEEEMTRFVQTMDNSAGFAPTGSQIQFFIAAQAAPEAAPVSPASGVVFGVPGSSAEAAEAKVPESGHLVKEYFGALSSQGVFVAGPAGLDAGIMDESKLSVPDSRIYAGEGDDRAGGILASAVADGLADAATAALR